MGICISKNGLKKKIKNKPSSSSPISPCPNPVPDPKPNQNPCNPVSQKIPHDETVKQTVSEPAKPTIVNQQKQDQEQTKCEVGSSSNGEEDKGKPNMRRGSKREHKSDPEDPSPAAVVRTSSCTKEEVDAILIQCGRLSRSSSGKASNENTNQPGLNSSGSKKYSGSKRSYEFQEEGEDDEKQQQQTQPSRTTHRRTPSRERDGEYKRSGSRDRDREDGNGKRRVSRSPGRRSETPTEKLRPGNKTSSVSGSATVSKNNSSSASAAIETGLTIKRATATANAIKRTVVNTNELGVRSSSPRSRSPVTRAAAVGAPVASMENANAPSSLSRTSSRKATDHSSPFRRNPTSENDENPSRKEPLKAQNQVQRNKENEEKGEKLPHSQSQVNKQTKIQDTGAQTQKSDENSNNNNKITREQLLNCRAKDQLVPGKTEANEEGSKWQKNNQELEEMENQPQTITRTRSSRRSREQFFPDIILDETHHHYHHHQQTSFSLPACVSKACSILEAVADLNSCNLSSNEKGFEADDDPNCSKGRSFQSIQGGQRKTGIKDCDPALPFVESKVVEHDDLIEPTFHKYVSVRDLGREMEQQESAGSNSFIYNQWTSWDGEPTSADSTDRWNSSSSALTSKSYTSEEVEGCLEPQYQGSSDFGKRRLRHGSTNSLLPVLTLSKKRDFQHGGADANVGLRSFPIPGVATAAAASL